ncbi:MAG: glycerol-3-phosphate responsive antiterminator [Blautia sp.]
MTKDFFLEATEISPVIPAVNSHERLELALRAESPLIYVLYGDICNIVDIVRTIKEAGKKAIVHVDLITGLASKEIAMDFMDKYVHPDGVISMKANLIAHANELGFFTIQRFYMMDVLTYRNVEKHIKMAGPDVVEFASRAHESHRISMENVDRPIVASGLVLDKQDIMEALKIGAVAVSTTNKDLWDC